MRPGHGTRVAYLVDGFASHQAGKNRGKAKCFPHIFSFSVSVQMNQLVPEVSLGVS